MAQNATSRLEARLPTDVYTLLKRAAEIEGRSLSDFVVSAARAAASRTIQENDVIRLSVADQELFAKTLANPPAPNAALKRAFRHHKRLFGK
jgi:uncharacterized protein (DUF1778 family)